MPIAPRYFITGTDTEVGKSIATAQLLRCLNKNNIRAVGMKPAASGCIQHGDILINDDVELHRQASPIQAPLALVSPYRFLPPISPHLAAHEAGVQIDLSHLIDCANQLNVYADTVLIEGAGGWFAPLSDSLRIADLAVALEAPVILVVGMRLGCINHALLSVQSILSSGLPLAGWIANQVDPNMARHAENLDYLSKNIPAPLLAEIEFNPLAREGCLNEKAIIHLQLQK
ncbi:dethiobiotin synthase [Chitinibacter sp. SCUT-21]|uniref:dethiobiotin synthase n=1 Tax=Chitinibacter sp. SCUT-21 TaxID=2970891 RepID=UPI0035A58ABD